MRPLRHRESSAEWREFHALCSSDEGGRAAEPRRDSPRKIGIVHFESRRMLQQSIRLIHLALGALLLTGAQSLHAQQTERNTQVPPESTLGAARGAPAQAGAAGMGWRSEIGPGVIINPESVGGDDYNLIPVPYFDFRYIDEKGTRYFANIAQGLGAYLYRDRNFQSGRFLNVSAALAPGFNVRSDDIPGLAEVDIATEVRLAVETGGRSWTANASLARDVGSGHEGMYLDVSLARRGAIGKRGGFYAVGPVLRLGDEDYKDSLFAVTAAESAASGLPEYSAGAGLERLGLQGLISLPMGDSRWRWTTIARAARLIDNAADSPVVANETQLFLLMSLTRRF